MTPLRPSGTILRRSALLAGVVLLVTAGPLSEPATQPWVLSARLEGGYTWPFSMGGPSIRFPPSGRPERKHLVPDRGVTAGMGARLSWRPSRFFGLFADAGLRVLFDSSDDLVQEHRTVEGFGWPVTLPLTLGLNVGF